VVVMTGTEWGYSGKFSAVGKVRVLYLGPWDVVGDTLSGIILSRGGERFYLSVLCSCSPRKERAEQFEACGRA
jgi:hypothetical protein